MGFENSQLLHKFQNKIRKGGSQNRRICDFSQSVAALKVGADRFWNRTQKTEEPRQFLRNRTETET